MFSRQKKKLVSGVGQVSIYPTVPSAKYAGSFRCGMQDLLHVRLFEGKPATAAPKPTSVTVFATACKRTKKGVDDGQSVESSVSRRESRTALQVS
jgi:hypothetical protein